MSIPRRPVGLGPSSSKKSAKYPSIAPSLASASIYSQPELMRSEPALYSERDGLDVPRTKLSPYSLESLVLNDDDLGPKTPYKDRYHQVPFKNFHDSVPPIPPKDAARTAPAQPTFRLADNAVHNTEIWKRRSTRSSSDLSFEDLKLSKSNGSTAGSPPRLPPPPPDRSLPPIPKQKSVQRKTLRSPPPRPPPQPGYMGTNNSKTSNAKLRRKQSHGSSTSPAHLSGRLPTPEYQKSDRRHPHMPRITSPASPASPVSPVSEDLPSELRRKPSKQATNLFKIPTNLTKKKSVPLLPKVDVQKSLDSDVAIGHSRSSSDTVTISAPTENTVFSAPQPQKTHATARILAPQIQMVQMAARSPPPIAKSPDQVSPYTARAIAGQNAGTIHPGPSVDKSHFDCYHKHRYMRVCKNDKCPLGCMVCDKRDTEKRWNCTWCSLRICTRCMEVLAANDKDLRICVAKAGKTGRGLYRERQDTLLMG